MIERPIVSLCLSLYFGMFFVTCFLSNYILFAALAAIFFIANIIICKKIYIIPAIIFFLMGIVSIYVYYNYHIGNRETIRINYSSPSYIMGETGRRRIYIRGNTKGLISGDKITAAGSYYKNVNYTNGNLGYFYIDSFKKENDSISKIYYYKENIYNNLKAKIGADDSSLIMALVFGDKDSLDEYKNEEYKEFGISHILCVSGFHMSLTFFLLQKFFGNVTAVFGSVFYLILVGAKPQAARSLIMIGTACLGRLINKKQDVISSLSLAFIMIIIVSPYLILDLGTLISFLAVLGIVLFNDKINKKLSFMPGKIGDMVSVSLSAQVFALPLIGYVFNEINITFLFGNLILVPILTAVIYASLPLLITINFSYLFNLNCSILKIAFYILQGAETLTARLIWPALFISRYFLISILLMFMFILFSRKYNILRRFYIPAVIIFYLGRYSIFPVLISTDNIYIIKNGFNTYLLSDYYINNDKDIIEAKMKYSPNIIYTSMGNKRDIILKKYKFICSEYKDKLKLMVYYNNIKIAEFISGENGSYYFLNNKIIR
jgi:competence protein ComEC